ncbi:cilia- and flagella-associated protein 77 [Heptranchias perlo]|uniref:cilia- and flagella-associated protein 77 n=1 Tax=Heptranchias perlo TaxID=212740 RepID=UPI0035593911
MLPATSWSETNRVGEVRDSMLINPLLIRSELGKGKRSGNTLPGPNHVYGSYSIVRDGGVPEAIGRWHTIQRKEQEKLHKVKRNFVALNRAALKAGLVTPQEIYQFRATHNIGIPGKKTVKKDGLLPDITCGIFRRPSTPMFDLLEHKYQQRWIEEQRVADEILRKRKAHRATTIKNYQTRASMLCKAVPPVEPAPIMHPLRYQKIGPHLDTFRSSKARRAAFNANWLDSAARRGPFGQGVYAFE